MGRFSRRQMLGAAVAGGLMARPALARATAPDMLLHGGRIFTGDASRRWVQAISIANGRIRAVGADADVLATVGAMTRVIDLGGRVAIAGINDAHDHVGGAPFGVQAATRRPPQADPPLTELAAAVREAAKTAPAGAWIQATGGTTVMRNGRATRAAMDEAAGNHPVLVFAWWGHGVILNTAGLAALQIDESAKDPPGGGYDRDSTGRLTGRLDEYAGSGVLQRLSSAVPLPLRVEDLKRYAQHRLQQGVTSVQIMGTDQRLDKLSEMIVAADVPLRLRVLRFPIPAEDARYGDPRRLSARQITPLARISGVKYVVDGTPIEQMAFQSADYPNRPGWRGRLNFDPAFLDAVLEDALATREPLALHVVGDATVEVILSAMERLAAPQRWQPLRVRLEHADRLLGARIARAHRLGIVVAQPRPGAPLRAWLDAGLPVAYGSDGGFAPWPTFQAMIAPDNPNAISREEALAVLTSGPAFAEFAERDKGKLLPGMLADVTVLSQDVVKAPAQSVAATHSLLTCVGGKIVFSSPEFAVPP